MSLFCLEAALQASAEESPFLLWFIFFPDCGEAFILHLPQTTGSFVFTCGSCSVSEAGSSSFMLVIQNRYGLFSADISAGALKSSISQETVEQELHAVLGLSADVPFEDQFNASSFCVRKEGMFKELKSPFYLS